MEQQEAKHENSVKTLYQDKNVAEKYIDNRFKWSWNRLLHESQVRFLNQLIQDKKIESALELAPGPARLTTEITGIKRGKMIEASEEMIEVASRRLKDNNLDHVWDLNVGNAFDLSGIDQTFDLVYTFRFIRHFEEQDRNRLYSEIKSCLAKNGLLVFDVVNKPTRNKIDNIESANRVNNPEKLPVYDVTYNKIEFKQEMMSHGFKVLDLYPYINHYFLQSWISYKFDLRIPKVSNKIVQLLEKIPSSTPLEWIAVCQKL